MEKQADSRTRELLREWGFDSEKFEKRAKESIEGARGDLDEVTSALRDSLASTKQTLLALQKNREDVVYELKGGFERAWGEIELAFAAARRRMHPHEPEEPEPVQPAPEGSETDIGGDG